MPALLLAVVAFGTLLSRAFSVSCPPRTACVTLGELRDGAALPEALHVYDREGHLLAEVAGPLRTAVPQEDIPRLLADAFVAAEDRRFWDHGGIDLRGVLRAAVRNVRTGDLGEGASTIPMQLTRTLWAESLRDVGPWRRKVIEARTAPRLVGDLGHERVLTLYLNAIYLGNGIYGVERASRHYFGRGVDSLDLGQMATLVGITPSPEFYEPRRHPDRARARRNVVLNLLAEAEVVTRAEAERAAAAELALAPPDSAEWASRRRTHFTAAVTRELRKVAPELADRPGLHVFTSIDALVQTEGEQALQAQLEAIERGDYGSVPIGDSVPRLEGAALALDPSTGAVLGWVGGRDFSRSEFDRVDQARRQVGSLVKPFLVASALERGFGMIDMVSSDTVPVPTSDGPWLPADHVEAMSLPLREALVRSSNRAAVHLGVGLGMETVQQVGPRFGLEGQIPAVPSTFIGAFDASLLEMTGAFTVFGNGGYYVEPYFLERVEGPDQTVLWARSDTVSPVRVLDESTAFVVLDAMRAVVDRGTGYPVRAAGYRGPAAGKTGTTNDGRDAWFIGMTPDVVAGVWIGFDQPRHIVEGGGGGTLAAPVWASWMGRLRRGLRPAPGAWLPPAGVERVRYDPLMGVVLGPNCGGKTGTDYYEAWVHVGRYQMMQCTSGVLGWFERLWRAVVPKDAPPVGPVPPRRPGGR
jgi:penicillin-binding protein 1A